MSNCSGHGGGGDGGWRGYGMGIWKSLALCWDFRTLGSLEAVLNPTADCQGYPGNSSLRHFFFF